MADRFPLILNTNANQIQEIASGDTLDLTGNNIKGVGVITATSFSGTISGTTGTFSGNIDANGDLNVDGHTNLDNVSISGVTTGTTINATTFVGNGDFVELDVDGHTNLDNVSIAGVTTVGGQIFSSYATLSAVNPTLTFTDTNNNPDYTINVNSGILKITDSTNTADRIVVNSTGVSIPNDLDVDGHTNLDNVSVAGVTTTTGVFVVNAATQSTNKTTGALRVAGGAGIQGNVNVGGDLDVDGHTNLDNVNVAGVTTFTGAINGASADFAGQIQVGTNNSKFGNNYLRFENAGIGYFDHNGTGQNINFRVSNSSSLDTTPLVVKAAGIDVTGNITATGNVSVGGVLTYEDVTNVDSVGIITARAGINLTGGDITLGDSAGPHKLKFGASGDFQLFHNGSNNYIDVAGVGNLYIRPKTNFYIQDYTNGEVFIDGTLNGAVQLYYDNVARLGTTSTGVSVVGTLSCTSHFQVNDNVQIRLGNAGANDFVLVHDGTDNIINCGNNGNLFLRAASTHLQSLLGEDKIVAEADGAVELYHDGTKKFETTSGGTNFHGSTHIITTGDFYPMNDNTLRVGVSNRRWSQIHGYEINAHEFVKLYDNIPAKFGADDDLSVLHSGSTGVINNVTGDLHIKTTGSGDDIVLISNDDIELQPQAGEDGIKVIGNGAVELFYDNSKKLETTNFGVQVTHSSGGGDVPILKVFHGNLSQGVGIGYNTVAAIGSNTNVELNLESQGVLPVRLRTDGNVNMIEAYPGGEVRLYHNGEQTALTYNTNGRKALLVGDKSYINNGVSHGELIVRKNLSSPNNASIEQCARMTVITNEQTAGGNGFGGAVFFGAQDVNDSNQYTYRLGAIGAKLHASADLANTTPNGDVSIFCQNSSLQERFRVRHDGYIYATHTSVQSLSDIRLKENIEDYSFDLDKFKQFKPITFNWKKPDCHTATPKSGKHRGFIAQDVQKLDSYDLISEYDLDKDSEEREFVDEDGIGLTSSLGDKDAMYVSVIQQLIDKIEKLESEVAALKGS